MPDPDAPWKIDLYNEGCCIYRLDSDGNIERIEAWARNAMIAQNIYAVLVAQYPKERFSLRQRGFLMRETSVEKP